MVIYSIKLDVTNNSSNENININMQGSDNEGFLIDNIFLTGTISKGQTKTLSSKNVSTIKDFKSITTWKLKN
jgi:hypothetical protein